MASSGPARQLAEGQPDVCGTLLAMPLIILNMGGEMMYILHQRLQAQKIADEKSKRVLQDVLATIFSAKFVDELFKPQRIYSAKATRAIFNRLAHSSIMRLNERSMDKLYDLMTMGFKHQILNATSARELITITLTHIDSLMTLIPPDSAAMPLLEGSRQQVLRCYCHLNHGTLWVLHQTLLRFLQDRRIKVSLFLQRKCQNGDGSFKMDAGGPMAHGFEVPGVVQYFQGGKETHRQDLQIAANYETPPVVTKKPRDFTHDFANAGLGRDLYADRAAQKASGDQSGPAKRHKPPPPRGKPPKPNRKAQQKAAASELNFLADLIGAAAEEAAKGSTEKGFNVINIDFGQPSAATKNKKMAASGANVVRIDAQSDEKRRSALLSQIGDLGLDDQKEAPAEDEEEEDLLDLLG